MIDLTKINEWKAVVLGNPGRLREEQQVIARYGTLFSPSNLDQLTKEDFASFLVIKNNRHWEGIHRQVNMITADMPKLRQALKILLDENRPLQDRLDDIFPQGKPSMIKGLGRAIVTAILLVVYPKKYGVFNNKSEQGLEAMGLLPNFKRKSFAEKYIAVNDVLNGLAQDYGLSLWQIDEIIGWLTGGNPPIAALEENAGIDADNDVPTLDEANNDFGLEAHLEEFLVENWDRLDLGKTHTILTEDGDIIGQQYITPIGRMDLLCKSNDDKEWLVLELKKGRSSDAVTGQVLRYMGWIQKNLAQEGETVRGMIVLGEADEKLMYSVMLLPNVGVATYAISFDLKIKK